MYVIICVQNIVYTSAAIMCMCIYAVLYYAYTMTLCYFSVA